MQHSSMPESCDLQALQGEVVQLREELNQVFLSFVSNVAEHERSLETLSFLNNAIINEFRTKVDNFNGIMNRYNEELLPRLKLLKDPSLRLDAEMQNELTYQKLCDAFDRFMGPFEQLCGY